VFKHYAMKAYGSGCIDPSIIIDLALVGGEWAASRFFGFIPGTHWIGDWVGPSAGLDVLEGRNILPLPGLELRP
jgi:hypothetical protein